jgi:hypothetical protein
MNVIEELLNDVEAAGIRLRLDPPDLVVKPAERLTPELEARLKASKPELVRRLESKEVLDTLISSGTWRTTRQIAKAVNLPEESRSIHPGSLTPGRIRRARWRCDHYFGLMSVLDAIQSLIWLRVNSERESRPKTGMT